MAQPQQMKPVELEIEVEDDESLDSPENRARLVAEFEALAKDAAEVAKVLKRDVKSDLFPYLAQNKAEALRGTACGLTRLARAVEDADYVGIY